MIHYTYRCRLLKPMVLQAHPGTENNAISRDYLPGSVFRGLAASSLYETNEHDKNVILDIFHNGNVQFGDAHIVINNARSHPIPATFYRFSEEQKELILHTLVKKSDAKKVKGGYLVEKTGLEIHYSKPAKGVRMKSARDPKTRSSKTGQLFMYQFLAAGQEFEFTLASTEEKYLKMIHPKLEGYRRLGRARSAEFGHVFIEKIEAGQTDLNTILEGDEQVLYAASNWCFMNEYHEFTWKLKPAYFGFEKGTINWFKSRVLHERYSPWNAKRENWDPERLIIKKGSVIVLKGGERTKPSALKQGVGCFKSEGMGEVILNPSFVFVNAPDSTAESQSILLYPDDPETNKDRTSTVFLDVSQDQERVHSDMRGTIYPVQHLDEEHDQGLVEALREKQKKKNDRERIDRAVNEFKREKKKIKTISPSQWGAIYAYAKEVTSMEELDRLLFAEDEEVPANRGFLRRGKMGKVWENEGHLETLKTFLETKAPEGRKIDLLLRLTLEMAKHHDNESNTIIAYGNE